MHYLSTSLSYLECKIAKPFWGALLLDPNGRAYSALQTPQLHNSFSFRYACRKTGTPKKSYGIVVVMQMQFNYK